MQWHNPNTAPKNGKAIRALAGDNLDEVVVRWERGRWRTLNGVIVFRDIEGWLPRETAGGIPAVNMLTSDSGWS